MTENPHGGLESLAGIWHGRVEIGDDFDELPEDIAAALGLREKIRGVGEQIVAEHPEALTILAEYDPNGSDSSR